MLAANPRGMGPDRTVRAHQLRFKRLQFPSLQSGVVAMPNTYGPALAEQMLIF